MAFGNLLNLGQLPPNSGYPGNFTPPPMTFGPPPGSFSPPPGIFTAPPGGLPGGGMSGLIQQAQQQSSLALSEQARQHLNPSFDETRAALNNAIENPVLRTDIQLNPRHEVAVLDTFMGGTPERPAHGFAVADVLRQTGGLDYDQMAFISDGDPNFHAPSPARLLTAPGDATPDQRLDSYIETLITAGMSQTNSALEAIADQPNAPNLRGVNYSTSGTDLNGFMALNGLAFERDPAGNRQLTPEGRVIFDALGIEHTVEPQTLIQFAERGINRFGQVAENSPLVQGQLSRHEDVSRKLQEQGIHYTVAAGNDGGVIEEYRAHGIDLSPTADDNIYANPYNVTVGSLDTMGTADPSDDRVASHSVQDPEVDFLANGVDRQVSVFGLDHSVTGTSFAAPDINGRLVRLSRENPGLSAGAVQNLLRNSAGPPIPGSNIAAIR